jgi:hypothetical protein
MPQVHQGQRGQPSQRGGIGSVVQRHEGHEIEFYTFFER